MIHVVKHIKPFLQSGHFYLNPWALPFPTEGVSGYFYYNHVLQKFLYVLRRLIWSILFADIFFFLVPMYKWADYSFVSFAGQDVPSYFSI